MLILFEWPAFCGKTSIINRLSQEAWWDKVPEFLLRESFLSFSVCIKNDHKKMEIAQRLQKKNRFVFLDRSYISTGVYVSLAKIFGMFDKEKQFMNSFSKFSSMYPKIDLCFLLKTTKKIGLARWKSLPRYQDSLIWYKKIDYTYAVYYKLLKKAKISVIEIDVTKHIDEVFHEIEYHLNMYTSNLPVD